MKALAANGDIKKVDRFRVPLGMLKVRADNIRYKDSVENRQHVANIKASLARQFADDLEVSTEPGHRHGSLQLKKQRSLCVHDIEVDVDADDVITVVDGNCSVTALNQLEREGVIDDRFLVDVLVKKFESVEEIQIRMLTAGQAKNPSPLEYGLAFRNFRDGVYGRAWSVEEIAERFKRSVVSVRTLLNLADADPRIHKMIFDDLIKSHFAMDIVAKHGDDAYEVLSRGVQSADAAGKAKVTAASINGRALPKKIVFGALSSIETFSSSLDKSTRRQLAEIENLSDDQLKGRKVEIDAALVLKLLKAGSEIDEAKQRQAERDRDRAAVAAQAEIEA
ncbi:hypothetical protein [Pandoraea sp. ISTKB]|uniref:hypothetical protein n=1 Tax=Pandoraea sp. ISTKB TaxID=1586708 RepID=UPI0008467136|nr:hypothetical protein [Pandoraea sp. ISTKB]ODP35131.1 hypothetical protein A9762_12305 [Pandoraea sp. ISTKB]